MTEKLRRVALATLGCKVAQYETEAIREAFLADGFCEVTEDADIVVVNTCTVTAEADRKCRQTIRRLAKESPRASILAIGCYAQSHPDALAELPRVAYVGGTADKMKTLAVANELLRTPPTAVTVAVRPLEGETYEPMCVSGAPRTRAYVKIADGCDCRCTYCAIPAARGPVRSRAAADILAEVSRLAAGGTREVVLTGIETASYGRDRGDGYRLIDLLEEVDRLGLSRVRLGSLTPEVLRGDFIPRLARLSSVAPHLHLSVQSGSSDVLRLMRRRYNAEQALAGVEALRAAIPEVELTCDMIVGFPGESKEDFAKTMDFARKAEFLSMHVFAYSAREGTVAATLPGRVPEAEKAERSATLSSLAAEMTEARLRAAVGRGLPLSVLIETVGDGYATGHTPAFLPVRIPAGDAVSGEVLSVRPLGVSHGVIEGSVIK